MARSRDSLKAGLIPVLWAAGTSLYAQSTNVNSALSTVKSQLSGTVTTILDIVMIVLGILLAIMLITAAGKHMKGGPEARDSILGWCVAVLFVLVGTAIIRTVFV